MYFYILGYFFGGHNKPNLLSLCTILRAIIKGAIIFLLKIVFFVDTYIFASTW